MLGTEAGLGRVKWDVRECPWDERQLELFGEGFKERNLFNEMRAVRVLKIRWES